MTCIELELQSTEVWGRREMAGRARISGRDKTAIRVCVTGAGDSLVFTFTSHFFSDLAASYDARDGRRTTSNDTMT